MALDFTSTLQRLLNPTTDFGGGPGSEDNVRGISQLILGGGDASVEDPETGAMVPIIGQGAAGANRTGLSPTFQETLRRAEAAASGALGRSSGKPSVAGAPGTTLVANPFGPGSFDPTNPAAVAAVQDQGNQARQVDQARQLIDQFQPKGPSTDFGSIIREITSTANNKAEADQLRAAAPGIATELSKQRLDAENKTRAANAPIIAQILRSIGITDNDFQKSFNQARGKALGEKAGGGGKSTIPPKLTSLIGKEGFDESLADAVTNGSIDGTQQLQLQRLHQTQWDKQMVKDPDRRALTGARTAAESLMRVQKAYEGTEAFKTGKTSDTLRAALALTSTGAAIQELAPVLQKLSPDERRYVAEYNTFQLNLRGVSQDSRFSNFDSERVIQAVGNPIVGSGLYTQQIQSAVDELTRRHNNIIDDLDKQGRRTKRFKKIGGGGKGIPEGAVDTGRTSGGKKVFRSPDGKLHVED